MSGLATIGEKCILLICEFVRAEDKGSQEVTRDWGGAWALSRLSRTCRVLYIAVRNLPSVLELRFVPRFGSQQLPRNDVALLHDCAYWSDLAGILWMLNEAQLVVFAEICKEGSNSDRSKAQAKLFVRVVCNSFALPRKTSEPRRVADALHEVGGLAMSHGSARWLIESTGFDLRECANLRFLRLTADYPGGNIGSSNGSVLMQLKGLTRALDHASVFLDGSKSANLPAGELDFLSSFQEIVARNCGDICDQLLLQRLRSLVLSFGECTPVTLPDFAKHPDGLSLELTRCSVPEVVISGRVHLLKMFQCEVASVSVPGAAHTLQLRYCPSLAHVSAVGSVHVLDISNCTALASVCVGDGVHTVAIDCSWNFSDVAALGSVHALKLHACSVTDVSALGRVYTVNIGWCLDIENVSPLGTVHTLSILCCDQVRDLSGLSNVHKLDLSGCGSIGDLKAIGSVHTLKLMDGCNLTDVSALGRVHTLDLSHCNAVTDVSALGGVHTLDLSHCNAVTDVSALGGVHTLDLSHCNAVTDVSALKGVVNLVMDNN